MKSIILLLAIAISSASFSQPYLDIAKIVYSYSPLKGLNEKTSPLQANFSSINLNIPIELKKGGDAIIINPFFENNEGEVSGIDFHVRSAGSLFGFLKRNIVENWNLLGGFIIRQNKEAGEDLKDDWQYGGVLLSTFVRDQYLSLKFGIYYNKEFFGSYFMPLAGIDWQINSKNNLFGVLPGSLMFEHKVNKRFFYGSAFRALTNSYRLQTTDPSGKSYLRVDDNQLGIFGDVYLTKKIVLTGETGYTILRRYRFGFKKENVNEKTDFKNDNFYFRATLAYRLHLR